MRMFALCLLTAILVDSWSGGFANDTEDQLNGIENPGLIFITETKLTFGFLHTPDFFVAVRYLLYMCCFLPLEYVIYVYVSSAADLVSVTHFWLLSLAVVVVIARAGFKPDFNAILGKNVGVLT